MIMSVYGLSSNSSSLAATYREVRSIDLNITLILPNITLLKHLNITFNICCNLFA